MISLHNFENFQYFKFSDILRGVNYRHCYISTKEDNRSFLQNNEYQYIVVGFHILKNLNFKFSPNLIKFNC